MFLFLVAVDVTMLVPRFGLAFLKAATDVNATNLSRRVSSDAITMTSGHPVSTLCQIRLQFNA